MTDHTDSGRRADHAPPPPERDHGSPPEPPAPAAPASDSQLPTYGVTGYNVQFYVHRITRPYGPYYFTDCHDLAAPLPDRVKPTSVWLIPCPKCFPDGQVPDRS